MSRVDDLQYQLDRARLHRQRAEAEASQLQKKLKDLQAIVDVQAEDPELWKIFMDDGKPLPDMHLHLQAELRRLHVAIEGHDDSSF